MGKRRFSHKMEPKTRKRVVARFTHKAPQMELREVEENTPLTRA